jgi:hypothetical protein
VIQNTVENFDQLLWKKKEEEEEEEEEVLHKNRKF